MDRTWLLVACVLGFVAVAGGAFGAHALKDRLTPDLLVVFQTGATYARFHVVALLAVAVVVARAPSTAATVAGACFVAGILLFTGSLWTLSLTGLRWLGAVTPLGGLSFLAGWVSLAVAGWRVGSV